MSPLIEVIMAKVKISQFQRDAEAKMLTKYFTAAQDLDPSLTQESLGDKLGVTQGLVGQWLRGFTPIPDRQLLRLGVLLGFNPVEFRPDLIQFSSSRPTQGNLKLAEVIGLIPPGEEERIAQILRPILEALKENKPK
jgi:transcriptional regulator with XRE-family HTH domain